MHAKQGKYAYDAGKIFLLYREKESPLSIFNLKGVSHKILSNGDVHYTLSRRVKGTEA